jgi:ParB family transcriptional regulator, chromosome partitioning protein
MASRSRSGRRLGRGLASLMTTPAEVAAQAEPPAAQPDVSPPAAAVSPPSASPPASDRLLELDISLIEPNPHQPRRHFDEAALKELADSILAAGLLQPIVVRSKAGKQGGYQLIAGERRWRAAKLAGLTTLLALVRETGDQEAAEFALIENLQRADLNPIERAEGLQALADRFGLTQADLALRVGMARPSIANLLRLLQLPAEVGELLRSEELSLGHGKILVGISDHQLSLQLASRSVGAGWSVRKLEQEVAQLAAVPGVPKPPRPERSPHLHDLETKIASHLGTKVHIREGRKKGSGKLIIEFYDLDQFDGLMDRFGFEQQ